MAAFGVNPWHLLAAAERKQDAPNLVEILDHGAMLNDGVGLPDLVDVAGAVKIDRPGVDTGVDLQQRHADTVEVAVDERPEASVRVAIFRADARVHDERADTRYLEDLGFQNDFAAGNGEVRAPLLQEGARLGAVGRRHEDARHRGQIGGVAVAQARDGLRLPRLVGGIQAQPGIRAKGDDVEELEPADAANLAPGGAPQPPWRITNDDETS
jgi:hypothetical protein